MMQYSMPAPLFDMIKRPLEWLAAAPSDLLGDLIEEQVQSDIEQSIAFYWGESQPGDAPESIEAAAREKAFNNFWIEDGHLYCLLDSDSDEQIELIRG
jgi:hypothetical protein